MLALFERKPELPFRYSLTKNARPIPRWNSRAQTCFTCCEATMRSPVPVQKPPAIRNTNLAETLSNWAVVSSSAPGTSTGSPIAARLLVIVPRSKPFWRPYPEAPRLLYKSCLVSKMPSPMTVEHLAQIQGEHFASSFRSIVGRPSWTASGFFRKKPARRHALHRNRFRG